MPNVAFGSPHEKGVYASTGVGLQDGSDPEIHAKNYTLDDE